MPAHPPPPTLSPKALATRQQLLDTGHGLMLQHGFSAVGLQEILTRSGVPKGSFYHYFPSKAAFGCAVLQQYVDRHHAGVEALLARGPGTGRERLLRYWQAWLQAPAPGAVCWAEQCLVVKLAAEVSDLSDDMREVLNTGVQRLLATLAAMIETARADGSLPPGPPALTLARQHYQRWLGAALLARLAQSPAPLQEALDYTRQWLAAPDVSAADA